MRINLVKMGDDDDQWKNRPRNLDPAVEHTTLYLRSLHWCMGVMSGYSDGTIPMDVIQYIFTLGVLNVGIVAFAYTVGAVGAIGEGNSQQSRHFQITVSAIHHFVIRYQIPDAFTKRITDYFAHRWESIKSNEKELVTAAELLEELPPCVRFDAVECMTSDALGKVPLFARVEEGFIHALTQKMEPISTSVGETLVKQGEVCDGLYIVLKGKLDVSFNGNTVDALTQGSCIGEQSMLTGLPANRTVTSLSFCELYRLRREPFEELQHKFKSTFEGFKQAAKIEAKNQKKQAKVGQARAGKGKPAGSGGDGGGEQSTLSSANGSTKLHWCQRMGLPILPHSRTRALWSGVLLVTLGYEVLLFPFKVVFVGNVIDMGLTVVDVFADVVMVLDLAARSVLAYTENGQLIDDMKQIRKRFKEKKKLIPFIISALPFSALLPLWPLCDARIIQTIRALRFVRFIPHLLWRSPIDRQQPSNLEELLLQVRSSAFDLQFAMNKLAPLLTMYVLCVHYVACGYWAVVMDVVPPDAPGGEILGPEGPTWSNQTIAMLVASRAASGAIDSSWLPSDYYLKWGDMLRYYLRAFYFATCNLTGLGAAVSPDAVASVLFTLGCFIMGVMVFAYLTSAIVTLVMQADAAYVSYKQKSLHLLGFMSEAHIDSQVMHRASKWLMQWWHAHGGVNLDSVIAELPPSLSLELRMHVFASATRQVPFWGPSRRGEVLSTQELLRLARDLRFASYNAGEWVLRKGMLNDDFYIVAFGVLQVLATTPAPTNIVPVCVGTLTSTLAPCPQVLLDDGTHIQGGRRRLSIQGNKLTNVVVAEVGKGECVGENSAINRGKCEASLRAKESVELLVVPRASMLNLCKRNPLMKHRLHRLMSQRFSENLYLTTGKLNVLSAVKAVGYMRKFVNAWRRRKAARGANPEQFSEGLARAGGPAPAPTNVFDTAKNSLAC